MNVLKQFEAWVTDLKEKAQGLKFKTWMIFTAFAVVILVLLWVLQLALIKPYYRSAKVNSIKDLADKVETLVINNNSVPDFSNMAAENGVCIQITNYNGYTNVYNAMGDACYFEVVARDKKEQAGYNEFIESINQSSQKEAEKFIEYNGDIAVYGKRIDMPLGGFYLLINGYVTPEKAGFTLIQNQFLILVVIVLIIATIASFLLSERVSHPLVEMTDSAKRLGSGDFDVTFQADRSMFTYRELHQLQETLDYATRELSQTDELRRDLLANVSHDIKTPLTMIMAYTEMILEYSHNDEEKMTEHLEIILEEAYYMQQLIEDMMELSQLESNVNQLDLEKFEFNDFIYNNTKQYIASHPEFSFEIKTLNDKVYVKADKTKISQVINNFVINALKFSKDNKKIIISTQIIDDYIYLSIEDFGVGINEQEILNIWDRYYQINKNHARDEGSGLGLAIAKAIIQAHDGKYGVKSKENYGSTFYFALKIEKLEKEYDE